MFLRDHCCEILFCESRIAGSKRRGFEEGARLDTVAAIPAQQDDGSSQVRLAGSPAHAAVGRGAQDQSGLWLEADCGRRNVACQQHLQTEQQQLSPIGETTSGSAIILPLIKHVR